MPSIYTHTLYSLGRGYSIGVRVGFDAHWVGQRETGNETYALGLLAGFERIGFAVDAYSFSSLTTMIHRSHRLWPRHRLVRIPVVTPLLALRDRLDLFHAAYALPPLLPCPGVVTVHDITFALHPEWFPQYAPGLRNTLVPLAMRKASRVITISEHTKRDIVARYGIPAHKIVVTYLAPRPTFVSRAPTEPGDEPYFLFVGNVEPRKNVETVVRALRILRQRGIDLPLVVAGRPGSAYPQVCALVHELGLENLVRFTGYVSDDHLRALYAGCTALVHPALYEGFGLTPLEAMAQGVPAIVADTSSLPEVVGDAALLVDPSHPEAWADAMAQVCTDATLRRRLIVAGLARAGQFSWERCARETVDVYRDVLG
jgi:glycosyltransferase involved in cell wall biosynthesis